MAPVYAEESTTLFAVLGGDAQARQGGFTQRESIRSTAAVPLRVSQEPVGALFVNFRRPQRFDAPQRQLIEGLANYAAIGIANARTFDALVRRRVQELEALRAIDRAISQTLDLKHVQEVILAGIKVHVPAEEVAQHGGARRMCLLAGGEQPDQSLLIWSEVAPDFFAFLGDRGKRQQIRIAPISHGPLG